LLTQLIHNGIIVPDPPKYLGLTIVVRGKNVQLTPKLEEMALAWVKKQGTPYVEDSVFVRNFMSDFSEALGIKPILKAGEVDFATVLEVVRREKESKELLSKEESKALAGERKALREALKEKYGYAIADGERIELANYITEPSGIFMGRGKHPLRGKWKEGASQRDITLNLSLKDHMPPGEWKWVWQPESLWVARWEDKLSGKMKYIWLHDTAPIKQAREAQKFDKATELNTQLDKVREHIQAGLVDENPKRRKIATACYLIDKLCLRVGDEKDPDEADTVGATTLRPEHVKLHSDGTAEFRFLGKDSVLWHKKIELDEVVHTNLAELAQNARPSNNGRSRKKRLASDKPQLFPDVSSRNVNEYLSEVLPGLTAKVFRTHHATLIVKETLQHAGVTAEDAEYKKWETAIKANVEAAVLCNHTKKAPTNWTARKEKLKEREKGLQKQLATLGEKVKEMSGLVTRLRKEAREKKNNAVGREKKRSIQKKYDAKIERLARQMELSKKREEKARYALGKLRTQIAISSQNRTWNLGTSQKSYIDPRVFYNWGKDVDYDVLKNFYSKNLQRKFMWVRNGEEGEDESV
jgi:DNA topoisomerase-1